MGCRRGVLGVSLLSQPHTDPVQVADEDRNKVGFRAAKVVNQSNSAPTEVQNIVSNPAHSS
jgi:hypothetical protein